MLFYTTKMLYKRANKLFQVLVSRDKACLVSTLLNKPVIDSSSPYYVLFASLWCGFYSCWK